MYSTVTDTQYSVIQDLHTAFRHLDEAKKKEVWGNRVLVSDTAVVLTSILEYYDRPIDSSAFGQATVAVKHLPEHLNLEEKLADSLAVLDWAGLAANADSEPNEEVVAAFKTFLIEVKDALISAGVFSDELYYQLPQIQEYRTKRFKEYDIYSQIVGSKQALKRLNASLLDGTEEVKLGSVWWTVFLPFRFIPEAVDIDTTLRNASGYTPGVDRSILVFAKATEKETNYPFSTTSLELMKYFDTLSYDLNLGLPATQEHIEKAELLVAELEKYAVEAGLIKDGEVASHLELVEKRDYKPSIVVVNN